VNFNLTFIADFGTESYNPYLKYLSPAFSFLPVDSQLTAREQP